MEKISTHLFLLTVIVITTALVIPMSGITAENDSVKNLQYYPCCTSTEEEKDNYNILSIPIIEANEYINY
jgi:hypothetical protein